MHRGTNKQHDPEPLVVFNVLVQNPLRECLDTLGHYLSCTTTVFKMYGAGELFFSFVFNDKLPDLITIDHNCIKSTYIIQIKTWIEIKTTPGDHECYK